MCLCRFVLCLMASEQWGQERTPCPSASPCLLARCDSKTVALSNDAKHSGHIILRSDPELDACGRDIGVAPGGKGGLPAIPTPAAVDALRESLRTPVAERRPFPRFVFRVSPDSHCSEMPGRN